VRLHTAIDELAAENERLRAEAARNHWLRDVSSPENHFYLAVTIALRDIPADLSEVDAAIDAVLQADKAKQESALQALADEVRE